MSIKDEILSGCVLSGTINPGVFMLTAQKVHVEMPSPSFCIVVIAGGGVVVVLVVVVDPRRLLTSFDDYCHCCWEA